MSALSNFVAPSFPPTQLTISTNSSTVTFTWTPPTNDADDNSIGYIVHCGSSTTALSYVLLSLSSRNYTLAFSREDARHYGNLTCHVTRFNSAGESGASNRVQIQFEIDSTVTTTTGMKTHDRNLWIKDTQLVSNLYSTTFIFTQLYIVLRTLSLLEEDNFMLKEPKACGRSYKNCFQTTVATC